MEPDDRRSGTYGRGEGGRNWRDPSGSAPRGDFLNYVIRTMGRGIYHR